MTRLNHLLLTCLACLVFAAPLSAQPEAAVDKRLRHLAENLRCLVCQNETLADSSAGLAQDLRSEIREMMVRGDSDRQIIAFLTQRYGDFVLYRPPLKRTTWLLWFAPALFVAGALTVMVVSIRRHIGGGAGETDGHGSIAHPGLTMHDHQADGELT
jgi:cytochrome c-type biogenesis protein CcmH